MTLSDIGERGIISEILNKRYGGASFRFGNDSSFIIQTNSIPDCDLVATTDPCPEPMSSVLGFDDYYYRGWLLATINFSDLAAVGAKPVGLLTSLNLPGDMKLHQFERLLDGVDDCCSLVGTYVNGGNIKESKVLDISATAIGLVKSGNFISRNGGQPGDAIVIIGDLGLFWAGVVAHTNNIAVKNTNHIMSNILKPIPKNKVGILLADKKIIQCGMDNSDGLYDSLYQLSDANKLGITIDFDNILFSQDVIDISFASGIPCENLMMGWGDWQLIYGIKKTNIPYLEEACKYSGIEFHIIGYFTENNIIEGVLKGEKGKIRKITSERFTDDSWFTKGINHYIKLLCSDPVTLK